MNTLWPVRRFPSAGREVLQRARPSLRSAQFWRQSTRSQHADESSLPRLFHPSTWDSIIPRSLRQRIRKGNIPTQKQPSNPANYFIWIYIFIGSQAIRILGLKNEFNAYMRKADLKLSKLREVVERLQRGEEVDVEKALGTGDEAQEREWEDALKELEDEDRMWQKNYRRRQEMKDRLAKEQQDADPVNGSQAEDSGPMGSSRHATAPRAPGFY